MEMESTARGNVIYDDDLVLDEFYDDDPMFGEDYLWGDTGMPYFITLAEQAERLADELFAIAVLSLESPRYGDFDKACETLEHAIRRCERRQRKAELVF